MNYRKTKYYLLISIALLNMTACQWKKATNTTDKLQTLKLGAMSSMDYIPYVIAEKKGIYDSLGVDVDIVKFFSANDRDAAFQAGGVDGTVIDYTGAILQQANGIPLKLVVKHDGFFYMLTGKDKPIRTLNELKGKKIAVSRNTVIEYSTDAVLQAAGLTEQDVEKPEINKIPLRLEMMQNGQIDACILPDPFATIALQNGNKALLTTRNLNISVTGTIFSEKALKEKRKEIQLLLEGYNLAVKYMQTHPLSDWSDILVQDAGVPAALVNHIVLPDYEKASLPHPEDIHKTIVWLQRKGLIADHYDDLQILDTIPGVIQIP